MSVVNGAAGIYVDGEVNMANQEIKSISVKHTSVSILKNLKAQSSNDDEIAAIDELIKKREIFDTFGELQKMILSDLDQIRKIKRKEFHDDMDSLIDSVKDFDKSGFE